MTANTWWRVQWLPAAVERHRLIDAETDELLGIWPSNGGHHDCVIIPTELEHMKHTRSCTL